MKSRKFAKNYIGSDRMKKSNSRNRDNENQLNFHGDERKVKYTFWCYFEAISSKQCLRLGPFIIIMQKAWFEI